MKRISSMTIGAHRNNPRLYLDGRYLIDAGFTPNSYIQVDVQPNRMTLQLAAKGRKVTAKQKGGREVSVIDINSPELAEAFGRVTTVEVKIDEGSILITPLRSERRRVSRVWDGEALALYSGAGAMDHAAEAAGIDTVIAVEADEQACGLHEENFPDALHINAPIQEVNGADLRRVGAVTAGQPCEAFSRSRTINADQSKVDKAAVPESHDTGHLIFQTLRLIDHTNPYLIVVECVPNFLAAGAGQIAIRTLLDLQYTVDYRVLDPREHGYLTSRKRAVLVATTSSEVRWPRPTPCTTRLGDLLDPFDAVKDEWFNFDRGEKTWLRDHWERHSGKGNGFAAQQLTADSTSVGTIKHGYFKPQGDSPVIKHPTQANTFRHFTVTELLRLHGLPATFAVGPKTVAGQMIGQGVHAGLFQLVFEANTRGLTVHRRAA